MWPCFGQYLRSDHLGNSSCTGSSTNSRGRPVEAMDVLVPPRLAPFVRRRQSAPRPRCRLGSGELPLLRFLLVACKPHARCGSCTTPDILESCPRYSVLFRYATLPTTSHGIATGSHPRNSLSTALPHKPTFHGKTIGCLGLGGSRNVRGRSSVGSGHHHGGHSRGSRFLGRNSSRFESV